MNDKNSATEFLLLTSTLCVCVCINVCVRVSQSHFSSFVSLNKSIIWCQIKNNLLFKRNVHITCQSDSSFSLLHIIVTWTCSYSTFWYIWMWKIPMQTKKIKIKQQTSAIIHETLLLNQRKRNGWNMHKVGQTK